MMVNFIISGVALYTYISSGPQHLSFLGEQHQVRASDTVNLPVRNLETSQRYLWAR